ncbi:hypothetical protein V6N12_002134 [Hibiscus sabdariffa]|uniref:Uncharacterized protein n=1 Tax=Hibiscus sabdariffa TaxID=183260 RepID=A0ABR2AZ96_9ROSI
MDLLGTGVSVQYIPYRYEFCTIPVCHYEFQEDEVLKAKLERRRSYSIPGNIRGKMRMLRHSGQNLGALGDKNGEKDKRESAANTHT